ncbi:polymorphic toxin type 50 domain-containing protein [Geobacillus thermoleovorans]
MLVLGVLQFSSKGEWINKELIKGDKYIGVYVDQTTGEEVKTKDFKIHYSKTGTHIVPTLIKERGWSIEIMGICRKENKSYSQRW